MKNFIIPYDVFRQKLVLGENIYENNFSITGSDKYSDCWIGYNGDEYWFGLTPDGSNTYNYSAADEILNAPVFDGKSMYDLWGKVVFYSVNGVSAENWFVYNCIDYYSCRKRDVDKCAKLACKLWKNSDYNDLKNEFEVIAARKNEIVFTAYCNGIMIAFAHCAIRKEYVEGTDSSKVAYLEAIFVEKEFRKAGVASYLIRCCENWAKKKECLEFASDCDINNYESRNMHEKNGFKEASKLVHYVKKISGNSTAD